jgi:hypothetical protein
MALTMDAMGCQRGIAQKIVDQKAEYVLALKGNQTSLHDDVKVFVAEQRQAGFKDAAISRAETVDGDHGRIETSPTSPIRRAIYGKSAWRRTQAHEFASSVGGPRL